MAFPLLRARCFVGARRARPRGVSHQHGNRPALLRSQVESGVFGQRGEAEVVERGQRDAHVVGGDEPQVLHGDIVEQFVAQFHIIEVEHVGCV